jgi:4-amino-4-deoxy-L-arabinose transferase-like glycosyltransferase
MFQPSIAGVVAVLAALSVQFAYFSVLLLPDSLVVLAILLSVYLIVSSRRHYRPSSFFMAGALVGLSCWLRANALLLPVFLGVLAVFVVPRNKRLSALITIIAGAILLIAPITIKSAVVFHRFIPVSLGTGQTLLEGIADYDEQNHFNVPKTDLGRDSLLLPGFCECRVVLDRNDGDRLCNSKEGLIITSTRSIG